MVNKKRLYSVLIVLTILVNFVFSMPYFKKCTKCIKEYKDNKKGFVDIGYMRIDYRTPYKKENGKTYVLYLCEHGHKVWVELK